MNSIQKIRSGAKSIRKLSVTCLAFDNAKVGRFFIGYDDKKHVPFSDQKIDDKEVYIAII